MAASTESVAKVRVLMIKHGYDRNHRAAIALARLRKSIRKSGTEGYEHMSNDVSRHYSELKNRLIGDGFTSDSKVMRTVLKLKYSLLSDGFSIADDPVEDQVTSLSSPESRDEGVVVKAFRATGSHDLITIETVFSSIPGWNAKVIRSKTRGPSFVVVYNQPSVDPSLVKTAIREYLVSTGVS